ncbi:hypothetical protein BpHYR1_001435 [Brachionus plicatilis]|uniref:Uncharacterized protein n=1 Tax=Brachionus plicatilis TaxID=10195 RepID=A0A3M7PUG4_BRAPC|nr:hypothetical protein BpHYR1_001435 [Brachionus plicatilis]
MKRTVNLEIFVTNSKIILPKDEQNFNGNSVLFFNNLVEKSIQFFDFEFQLLLNTEPYRTNRTVPTEPTQTDLANSVLGL